MADYIKMLNNYGVPKANDCVTLNKDNTCNSTMICDETSCIAIQSNYKNVHEKASRELEWAQKRIDELVKRGYVGEKND